MPQKEIEIRHTLIKSLAHIDLVVTDVTTLMDVIQAQHELIKQNYQVWTSKYIATTDEGSRLHECYATVEENLSNLEDNLEELLGVTINQLHSIQSELDK